MVTSLLAGLKPSVYKDRRYARLGFGFGVAAGTGGDGVAVGAGFGVAEESADALVEFGGDDVLEFAGLRVGFGVVDGEGVFEEALGEAMTADDVAGALAAGGSEMHVAVV